VLNIIDASSMMLLNAVIVSSGSFATTKEDDIPSFVAFHFILISCFSVLVALIAISIARHAAKSGPRGDYSLGLSPKTADNIANTWIQFVDVSSKMPPDTIKHCIETFNEFDVKFLRKCMASFQSIDSAFGTKSAPRLNTISHSSKSIDDVQAKVKDAEIQAKNEASALSNASPAIVFI